MALLITPPEGISEAEVKDFLATKYPAAKAEHWEDEFAERDENGNFRELNLAIPGPPVSKEYWEWHMEKSEHEADNNIDMATREDLVEHLNKLTNGRLNLK